MKKLEERAAAIARAAQRRKIGEIEHSADELGVRVEAGADEVILSGRGLVRRWLNEASLRFITGLMR